MKNKVLLVYANSFSDGILPIGISMLVPILKQKFDVKLFDTTFYPGKFDKMRQWREKSLEYKKLDEKLYDMNESDVFYDFDILYKKYNPDLKNEDEAEKVITKNLKKLGELQEQVPELDEALNAILGTGNQPGGEKREEGGEEE